jgi:hypothetical protein
MGRTDRWMGTGVWVGTMLLGVYGTSACAPGELDTKQEKYLRSQLKKHYPAPKTEADAADDSDVNVSPDTVEEEESTTGEESTSEEGAETTSVGPTTTAPSSDVTETSPDAGGGAVGEIPKCVMQMFMTTCSGAACHTGGVFSPNLADDSLFELLTTTGSPCSTRRSDFYIDLESPDDSYLLQRIVGEGCGSPMPPPPEPIPPEDLDCLEDWLGSL